MTDRLPPNLLRLFQPRPPVEYLPPLDIAPIDRKVPTLSGVSEFIDRLKVYDLDYVHKETPLERRERLKAEKIAANDERIAKELETWDPHKNTDATSDPFKTLFVGRLSYKVTKDSLAHEFERFGPILKIKLVKTKDTNAPRGYAFIEYQRESDMMAAVKSLDGIRIEDRRIVVDVERARTVKGWRPRRLGGGLGHTRFGPAWTNQDYPGRDMQHAKNQQHPPSGPRMADPPSRRSGPPSRPPRRRSRSPPRSNRSRSRDRKYRYSSSSRREHSSDRYRHRHGPASPRSPPRARDSRSEYRRY